MNLKDLQNQSILLFGKPRAFNEDEFNKEIQHHKINIVNDYNNEVVMVIDGKMMTPYEQNKSEELYQLYSNNIDFIDIDIFEKELVKDINPDTLYMSLKLSRDKTRLKSFLQNSCISDELFLKLLKLYSWQNEDFFENDDNRDISAAFILRFYQNIERNHNVQYATTGFMHLIKQVQNVEILKTILMLQPVKYNNNMKVELAKSPYINYEIQNHLKKDNNSQINESLSLNENLNLEIIQNFLNDEKLGSNVAKSINLTDELFEVCNKYKIALALNKTLNPDMQKELLKLNDENIKYALALNESIDIEILEELLKSENEEIVEAVYENKICPVTLLKEAYENNKYFEQLAKNENTPIDILYQLNLDSKYERAVKTNASFGKNIQQENLGWL